MIPFRTENGAVFRCRIEPAWTTYANLNFHSDDDTQIPFHVSLRLTEGIVVVNHKDRKGWKQEVHIALAFPTQGFPIEVDFSGTRATVRINGAEIGQFRPSRRLDARARYLVRHDFSDLRKITRCSADGAVPWESIETHDRTFDRLWARVTQKAGLVLTDRMELAERLPDGQTSARHAVHLPGKDTPVLLIPATVSAAPRPNTFALPQGIAALLIPGRIWIGTRPEQSVSLRITDAQNGREVAAFPLSRQDVSHRIQRLARDGGLAHDDLAALQAIEHVRYAGIWDQLDLACQSQMKSAAARLGLAAFLDAPQHGTAPLAPRPHRAPETQAISQITEDLSDLLRTGPDRYRLRDWLQAALAKIPDTEIEPVAFALCPTFCEQGAFDLLFAAIKVRGVPEVRPWDDVGYVSMTLPFQLMDGKFDQVISRTNWLVSRHGGWLVTSALGWMAKTLARPGAMSIPEDKRHDILSAFCAVIADQAKDPWGRAACHCLMDGILALIDELPRLPRVLRGQVATTAVSAYGLSPRFWARISDQLSADTISALPPDLLAARQSFEMLQAPCTSDQKALALSTLSGLKCQGVQAAALHTFPAMDLRRLAPWHDDVLLRSLFAPGTTADPDFEVRSAINRSLPIPDRVQPVSAFGQLERRLGEAAFHLLSVWHTTPALERMNALETCLADAHSVAGHDTGHLGLAVGLSLLVALQDDRGARDRLLVYLRQIRASFGPVGAADCRQMPALRSALDTICNWPLVQADVCDALGLEPMSGQAPSPNGTSLPDPATALFSTLVVVMSCHPNLHTRIPAMREAWLSDLTRLGIPYIIVVGKGAETVEQTDIVVLDAPDDYEGLPQKSLAALAYAHRHFPRHRVLKIDDDCFLDVPEYFFSLSFLKADYYGRRLARARGQMDRTWHMAKSASLRGRHELDKSPEPSTYADGGSGYLVSPLAISTLLGVAKCAEGQRLIHASFMEDKLVGDLLSLGGISLSSHDYRVHVLRRSRTGGHLVPKWENTCLPFVGSGVKLAHLDGHELQLEAARVAKGRKPATSKIWSTLAPARLGAQSNALDLISPAPRLERARMAPVSVVATMRNEMAMLPQFLAHYRALGVESFLIADNGSDDGTLEHLADQPDVALFTVDSDYRQSHYGVLWQQALMAAYRPETWSLVADADELLVWTADATGSLPQLLAEKDVAPYDAVRIFMLDMYPEGPLSRTDFSAQTPFAAAPFTDRLPFLTTSLGRGPFSDSRTWTSATRHRLLPGSRPELFVAQKIALLRYQPCMRLSDGLHYVAEANVSPRALLFGHFKYNAAFRAKAVAEVARGQHFNNAEEYRKYLDLISEGRETLFDPDVSVHWTDSAFVQSLLTTGRPPD